QERARAEGERAVGRGQGPEAGPDHPEHRAPDAPDLVGRGREALSRDLAPLVERAGAMGTCHRQARRHRATDRRHGGPRLREAVDKHLQVAGDVVMPGKSPGQRLRGLVRAAGFYAWWYPSRWLGWSFWPKYAEFGVLARHLRAVERGARRLARGVFHAMVRFGPKLEYRQAVLFRLVDVGAELFAMTAACARAQWLLRHDPAAGRRAVELADPFCRQAAAR